MGKLWFTADTHFYHKNIIKYCERPFANVGEMNRAMLMWWNNLVSPNDIIVHLGDFAFCSKAWAKALLGGLNGTKILVRGNHDGTLAKNEDIGFSIVCDGFLMRVGGQIAMLSRVPPQKPEYPVITGHVHKKWSVFVKNGFNVVNVGVDVNGFKPVSEDMVARLLK